MENHQKTPDSDKRPYTRPRLISFGKVSELTQAGTAGNPEEGAQPSCTSGSPTYNEDCV